MVNIFTMPLNLPSNYSKDYWNAIRERLELVSNEPTLENLMETVQGISSINKCLHVNSLLDTGKLSRILSSYIQDSKLKGSVIATICSLALEIEVLFPSGFTETLQASIPSVLVLSATQIHCLLAHMFLGTFRCCIGGETVAKNHANGPFSIASRMSFLDWYAPMSFPTTDIYIRAILNLFKDITIGEKPEKSIVFERRFLERELDLKHYDVPLVHVNVLVHGRIGDVEEIEIDFANACVGGGPGGTQEELLLGISPEALPIGILNSDPLLDNEAIVISGAKKYANYTDFGLDAAYAGSNEQSWDWAGRKIIAIDALCFEAGSGENRFEQMQGSLLKRELHKCYVGFLAGKGCGISTGHWGCGAFGGDKEIKAVIQVIAASIAGVKHLNFFTFGERRFADEFRKMMDDLKSHDVRVNRLWSILMMESEALSEPVSFKAKYDPDPYLFSKISSYLNSI